MSLKLMCAFGLDLAITPLVAWADGKHVYQKPDEGMPPDTWWDREMESFGAAPVDDYDFGEPPSRRGLWIWEGTGQVVGDEGPTYQGSWRKATVVEALAYHNGESPFPKLGVAWLTTTVR